MSIIGPVEHAREACEKILRSLPGWFGIESALIEYAEATDQLPTFLAMSEGEAVGFVSVKQHGATRLIVKTLAESHPSPEYKESRVFYLSQGFVAEKIIPDIWGVANPCLQMQKEIRNG